MKTNSSDNTVTDSRWLKTPVANLVRHIQSGIYYARIRVRGKLIWKSLKTDRISVAKVRLADFHFKERQRAGALKAVARGKMTFGNAVAAYKQQRQHDPEIKPGTIEYDNYRIEALLESWPELEKMDVSKITESDCKSWSEQNAKKFSSSSHNHTVGILRRIFKIAIEVGARYDNPALAATRVKEHTEKQIKLPELSQFEKLVTEIKNSGSGFSKPAAELVQFLAYGGFRKSEAANITWADCDFKREKIILRGDPVTGLKRRRAGEFREIPMIPEMRKLLEQMRATRPDEPQTEKVMRVFECQKSLDTACKKLGIARLTHHDLRHLFATRCIESGVDIPAVSRWLGHKDGGTLAMKTYGHLRDEHSTTMAQKVVFVVTPTKNISAATIENLSNDKPADAKHLNKVIAQTKAKYAYPWWASNNPTEVFWGQINEEISIVSFEKYHAYAEKAMGRPIFTHEFGDPQALIDEFVERISKPTLEDILKKIPAIKQKAA
jgi:integrase